MHATILGPGNSLHATSAAANLGRAVATDSSEATTTAVEKDSFGRDAGCNEIASSIGAPPPLPDVYGVTDPGGASWRVGWLADGDGALMWATLDELARSALCDMKSAKESKRAFQGAAVDAKKSNLSVTEQRQAAEREEAVRKLGSSVVTACIVCAVASAGAKVGIGAEAGSEAANTSAAIIACARAVGEVHSKYADMASTTNGPQRDANDKELEAMRWDINAEMMEQMVEESQSSYDESNELFKLALRILTEHYELQSQAVQTYTRA